MTIKHMRVFVTVYQQLNITKAAVILNMTQPAVTRAIKELESCYGVCLFERINHRLYRTKCGDYFYEHAFHIIESFDNLEKGIKNWDEFGILRVGASITLGNFFLPELVKQFQDLHHNLKINVTISNAETIQQGILNNKIDVAVIEGNATHESIFSDPLASDHLKLIIAADHPLCTNNEINVKDIMNYPMLLREKGSAGRSFLDHVFALHGFTLEPAWESTSTQALVNAVSLGLGVSILPARLIAEDIKSHKVISLPVKDESFIRNNYIIWHQQKYLSKTTKEFIALCHTLV